MALKTMALKKYTEFIAINPSAAQHHSDGYRVERFSNGYYMCIRPSLSNFDGLGRLENYSLRMLALSGALLIHLRMLTIHAVNARKA